MSSSKIKTVNSELPENMHKVTLAIVFIDIINSTKFVQKNGAKSAAAWFQAHDRLARSLVYKHSGREIDRSDGFMLSFYNLGDAIQFALKYQEIIPKKTPFNSRVGIHWTDIIEVHQEDKYTSAGAKRVELEGIGKATAARCMSICQEKQVLLTKSAHLKFKSMLNAQTYISKLTRTVLVGLYQFKGVKNPQEIYAIGNTIEVLQPPPSGEKVKRIGGAKKIKSRAKDRKFWEWIWWFNLRGTIICFLTVLYILWSAIFDPDTRKFSEMQEYFWWADYINEFLYEANKKIEKISKFITDYN
jgi:class 3 adenylate cyclase